MKKALKFSAILFFASAMATYSFGQPSSQSQKNEVAPKPGGIILLGTRTPVYSKMKTEVVAILEIVYPKAARNFAALFPAANNQVWIIDAGTLFVSFFKNGNKTSAVFTTGGAMRYSITHLKSSDIPFDIFKKISDSYGAYSIFNVKEITVGTGTVYQVILENGYEFVIIRVNHDDLEESKRIQKQA